MLPAVYDAAALEPEQERGSWRSGAYVAEWLDRDVLAEFLRLPMEITAAIVADAGIDVTHIVDLGSGSGAYLNVLLEPFAQARATWVDASAEMEAAARERLAAFGDRVSFVRGDLAQLDTIELEPAEVVVTSRALHNLPPASLEGIYGTVYSLIDPGGFFFNLDHFATPPEWESRYRRIRERFTGKRRPIAQHRDHVLGELASQLRGLEDAGFEPAGIPWRAFSTALVAVRKPD